MSILLNKNLALLVFLLLVFSHLSAEFSMAASETDKSPDERMQWWRDAKFGMFIHWGVYAVPAGTWEPAEVTGGDEWIMYGDFDQYLREIAVPQVKEFLGGYDIDVLWWDTPVWMNAERARLFQPLLEPYPELIQNDRLTKESHGDYETPENFIPARGLSAGNYWETCMTMNGSWGYDTHATDWMPPGYFIRSLIDVVLTAAVPADGSKINLALGGQTITASVPDTGSYDSFLTTKVGRLTIAKSGRQILEIQPVKEGWTPVNLRSLQLLPVADKAEKKLQP